MSEIERYIKEWAASGQVYLDVGDDRREAILGEFVERINAIVRREALEVAQEVMREALGKLDDDHAQQEAPKTKRWKNDAVWEIVDEVLRLSYVSVWAPAEGDDGWRVPYEIQHLGEYFEAGEDRPRMDAASLLRDIAESMYGMPGNDMMVVSRARLEREITETCEATYGASDMVDGSDPTARGVAKGVLRRLDTPPPDGAAMYPAI